MLIYFKFYFKISLMFCELILVQLGFPNRGHRIYWRDKIGPAVLEQKCN